MITRILNPNPENLRQTARLIHENQVVGMPTETVYGLAGNSLSPLALTRIFETKNRPTFDPLILHVGPGVTHLRHLEDLELIQTSSLTRKKQSQIDRLIQAFWPGPLTLVLPKHPRVPDLATSGLPSVAIRMPQHPVAQALITAAQVPLAAPSANRFGRISPTSAQDVLQELGGKIPCILEGGSSTIGVESTILSFVHEEPVLLRPGGLPLSALERVLETSIPTLSPSPQTGEKSPALAPGMLSSHYAPQKPLFLLERPLSQLDPRSLHLFFEKLALPADAEVGLLVLSGSAEEGIQTLLKSLPSLAPRPLIAKTLSPSGDLSEAARALFSTLRELDASTANVLLAEPCLEPAGLGFAIADRLKRASVRSSHP